MPFIVFFLFGLFSSLALAGAPPRGGPPPEAFSACQSIGEGASCGFNAPHGQITGQCRRVPEGKVCVPGGRLPANDAQMRPNPTQTTPISRPDMPTMQRPQRVSIEKENPSAQIVTSKVPDTNQGSCFDEHSTVRCPQPGMPYFGQDAQYLGAKPSYRDNSDGSISDLITGLRWEKAHHETRLDFYAAKAACDGLELAGRTDWRLPSVKELYSIMDFRGAAGRRPYLDDIFEIRQPAQLDSHDPFASSHSPEMMGQTWTSTIYAGEHYGRAGVEAAFFVNFLDGRIKQAPANGRMGMFYRCVAGPAWGNNEFVKEDVVVTDKATELSWQRSDDGQPRNWPEALAYCENLNLAGYQDWRLPNAKELQTIVDYTQSSPALDQRFFSISDPKAWYWSSTTLGDDPKQAVYVCFGACTSVDDVDVHGAGAQRSDPKLGNPQNYGPMGGQRDEVRINNLVRCVR